MDLDLDILGPYAAQYQKLVKEQELKLLKRSGVAPGPSAGTTARRY